MTTTAAAVEAILQQWKANTSLAATAYCFDNEAFEPQAQTAWARVLVGHVDSYQRTIAPDGARMFERDGVIVVQLHIRSDLGRATVDALVDATRTIFEGKRFSGIICGGKCPVREVGNVGRWFQVNVEAAFYYEEVK